MMLKWQCIERLALQTDTLKHCHGFNPVGAGVDLNYIFLILGKDRLFVIILEASPLNPLTL